MLRLHRQQRGEFLTRVGPAGTECGAPAKSSAFAFSRHSREPHRDDATSHRQQRIQSKWVDDRGPRILGKLLFFCRRSGEAEMGSAGEQPNRGIACRNSSRTMVRACISCCRLALGHVPDQY